MSQKRINLYEEIGGENTVLRLVEAFYGHVSKHPVLIPLFPDDFKTIQMKQKRFLTQFLGGPPLYTEEFGHPMMRARHLRFPIGPQQRDAWLECMDQAMTDIELAEPWREFIFQRLTMTANHMMNMDENGQRGD